MKVGTTLEREIFNWEYCRSLCLKSNGFSLLALHGQLLNAVSCSRLQDAEAAFKALAESYSKDSVGNEAYRLYEQFRPEVASGKQGWGKKGELNLKGLKELHAS